MRLKIIPLFQSTLISLLFAGCANIVTPTGGEKDVTPPEPVSFEPANNSVNFNGNSITIKFKDYIELNDIFNQVLISPPLDEAPDFKLRGKSLNIEFKTTLKDSTTYTINFGQSIRDITEGNVLDNFTYVFSTGSELDSLTVEGTIVELYSNSIPKSVYAVLYLTTNDSAFLTGKPYYFAKADASGKFIIKNIKEGDYRIYALEDQNFNYYYDLPNENIAFLPEVIRVDTAIQIKKLQIFSEDRLPQSVTELKSIGYGVTRIAFSKPSNELNISYVGDKPENGFFIRNKTNDTLLFWHPDYKLGRHRFHIQFEETDTTREVQMKSYPADSIFFKQKNTFASNLTKPSAGGRSEQDLNKQIILSFNHPLKIKYDSTKQITAKIDSVRDIPIQFHIDSSDSRKLIIDAQLKELANYDIYIPQKLTEDIFGLYNDSLTLKFTTRQLIDYATLSTIIQNKTGNNLIIQFLSSDLKTTFKEVYLPDSLFIDDTYKMKFTYLSPGTYKIRAIIDADSNGKWTTGNLMQNKLPEAVYFFPVDQNLRANWETEIEWVIE